MEMKKHAVMIDNALCIGCGMCERDCVAGRISVQNRKAAVSDRDCIFCGHCEAVCPQGAVTITGFTDESTEYPEQTRLDHSTLMQAIRTRRSIRQFRPMPIAQEITDEIIEAGRLAPTGGNAQTTGFIILGSRQTALEELAVTALRRHPAMRERQIDNHFFFKGAPLVIVVTGDPVNGSLAAENMAFMAEAHGLGVLFSGYFTMAANNDTETRTVLQMAENEKAVITLVLGFPDVEYHRTVRRENARLRIL